MRSHKMAMRSRSSGFMVREFSSTREYLMFDIEPSPPGCRISRDHEDRLTLFAATKFWRSNRPHRKGQPHHKAPPPNAPTPDYNGSPVTCVLSPEIKRWLKRAIVIGITSALALTALAYAIDYAVFRYKVAKNRQAFAQFTVTSYDAIPQKSGKTLMIFHPPEQQTCVNSLFPREGYPPCWYLQRHTEQRIDM
jgi:hypothetical protein